MLTAQTDQPTHLTDEAFNQPQVPSGRRKKTILVLIFITVIALSVASVWLLAGPQKNQPTTPRQPVVGSITLTEQTNETTQDTLPTLPQNEGPPTTQLSLKTILATAQEPAVFKVGEQKKILVTLSSSQPEQLIDGVELVIEFEPEKLGNVTVVPGKLFSSVARNTVSQEAGTISLMLLRKQSESVVLKSEAELATILVTPLKIGETALKLDRTKTVVAANAGSNILEKTQDVSIIIE